MRTRYPIWKINDLVEIIKNRQKNEFDMNIIISGARGEGKSSTLWLLFRKLGNFKPIRDMCYRRKEVMHLLESRKYGCIMDDEAVRTAYKRSFFESEQIKLIQMLNMYRDNFNVYGVAVPSFFSLDKEFRKMFKIHIHIFKRGKGVVHISNNNAIYSDDPWDSDYNAKIEQAWMKQKKRDINFKEPYQKLTTFQGYIRIPKLSAKEQNYYKHLKRMKRREVYEEEGMAKDEKDSFMENLFKIFEKKELTIKKIQAICIVKNVKYEYVIRKFKKYLKENKSYSGNFLKDLQVMEDEDRKKEYFNKHKMEVKK
jgi:hypothetical protein